MSVSEQYGGIAVKRYCPGCSSVIYRGSASDDGYNEIYGDYEDGAGRCKECGKEYCYECGAVERGLCVNCREKKCKRCGKAGSRDCIDCNYELEEEG